MTSLKSSDPRGTYVVVCHVCIDGDLYNCFIPAGCAAHSAVSLHSPPNTRSTGECGLVMSGWLQTVMSLSFLCYLVKTTVALGLGRVEEAAAVHVQGRRGSAGCGKCRETRGSFCTVLEGSAALSGLEHT